MRGIDHRMGGMIMLWNSLVQSWISRIPATHPWGTSSSQERLPSVHPDVRERNSFGRLIGDLFDHSWRVDLGPCWIWIPKPATLGEVGYPARPEEIRREGWRARRVVRVRPPPPLPKSFASAVESKPMAKDLGKGGRGPDVGGGFHRRFEEDMGNGWNTQRGSKNDLGEMDLRRGASSRGDFHERSTKPDDYIHSRDEDPMGKRKAVEAEFRAGLPRRRFNQDPSNPQTSVHDRLGPSRQREEAEFGRGGFSDTNRAGFKPKDADIFF